jgi:hypothetical protein
MNANKRELLNVCNASLMQTYEQHGSSVLIPDISRK